MKRQTMIGFVGLAFLVLGCSSSSRRRGGDAVDGTTDGATSDATNNLDFDASTDGVDAADDAIVSADAETPSDGTATGTDGGDPIDGPDITTPPVDTNTPPVDTNAPPDTNTPPDTNVDPVGLLGKACANDADCQCTAPGGCGTTATHTCVLGVCSAFCQGEQSGAGACDNIAPSSGYQGAWGCPSDIVICLPGSVEGKQAGCVRNQDCNQFGNGLVCSGAFQLDNSPKLKGLCLPDANKGQPGASCGGNGDCSSNLCLSDDTCSELCSEANDCSLSGQLCIGVGFLANDGDSQVSLYIGACASFPGTLNPCSSSDVCPSGEYCDVSIDGGTLQPAYTCRQGGGNTPALNTCSDGPSECETGSCLLTQSSNPYCSGVCPNGDCPQGLTCQQNTLHNNGTLGDTGDDVTFGLCVAGAANFPCLEGLDDWCDSGFCDGSLDPAEGVGLCDGAE